MGTVYEAEQDQPRRTVALKVIRLGLLTPDLLRRFELESQLLARLQHPGIAQVYDAGTAETAQGRQPYFAMELIEGDDLDVYVKKHALGVAAILELMAQVCDAVQHAHQKGVVHRDLKPANILVNREGQPKVLDFGVARATDSDLQATLQTEIGQIVGTLPYMSPEQLGGSSSDVDTRSDVYSLGVILYELLAGRLPHEIEGKDILDVMRSIREEDSRRLSSISRVFRGDIETITAKALEKDRELRYRSPDDLAADLRRHLASEPIVARPASARYQFAKFARRNRVLVGGIVAVFLALAAGLVVSSMQASRARRAEALAVERLERSELERAKVIAVKAFLQEMLQLARPDSEIGRDGTVREALDVAIRQVEAGSLAEQPLVEIEVRGTIALSYKALGRFEDAKKVMAVAVDLARKHLGPTKPVFATFLTNYGLILESTGELEVAEAMAREALEVCLATEGAESSDALRIKTNLGGILRTRGDLDGAEVLLREVIETQRRVFGEGHLELAASSSHLGRVLMARNELDEARSLMEQVVSIRRAHGGDRDSEMVRALSNLAVTLGRQDRWREAESMLVEALELDREILGDEHPGVANDLDNLATTRVQLGELGEETEAMLLEALRIRQAKLGGDHLKVAVTLDHLGSLHKMRGDLDRAEPLYGEALAIRRAAGGEGNQVLRETLTNLAELWLARGGKENAASAERLFREHLEITRAVMGDRNPEIAVSLLGYAESLLRQGKFAEAEPLAREALSIREEKLPASSWRRYSAQTALGAALIGKGDFAESEALLLGAQKAMEEIPETPPFLLKECAAHLASLHEARGKAEQAASR
ncbi:Serine/threonine-protein kinase PknB [Planctomycetes bacterium Poly30]|uniref:Serine/threonine-protein kinase PknB n=2 Tax=Saltatorellus ferox TaxID=2528018 RepID=A0A518EMF5_9BACT|nr:Serine/threonine-protein kinase PknB [Planctomycetes bacterium Poly30]